jgi:hypothetical protein
VLPFPDKNSAPAPTGIQNKPVIPYINKEPDQPYYATASFFYTLGQATVQGEEGSMKEETPLSIHGLGEPELPPLNTGMVNVTDSYNAFRMLPAGMVFEKDVVITLPYDSALLPMGYTPYDIMTYYYDTRYERWIMIEREYVDTENQLIVSRVNHFTDFVNAVIRTPEMPETSAHVPTQMSGMKAANPLETINIIQPPVANNSGTANLAYPIEVPAGRQGMQPNLSLTYSSGGGNGWMGIGWDISIPAITVETRWGVPRYDALLESEGYLLNGQQLTTKDIQGRYDPLIHRGDWRGRMHGSVQFYTRVEGAFLKIIRHGNSPKNYWLEVHDKNGMIYYYGKADGVNAPATDATLRDAHQNIAKWQLTEVRDLYGNTIKYKYETIASGYGKAIYPKNITYTGFENEEGKYKVDFVRTNRQSLNLKDLMFHGRYGFMETSYEVLTKISVSYADTLLKEYLFEYISSNHNKTLLKKISESYDNVFRINGGYSVKNYNYTFELNFLKGIHPSLT